MNAFLLMMGGSGTRFGRNRPKQYTVIEEAPLFSYILGAVDHVDVIDYVVVVSHGDWLDYVEEWSAKVLHNKPFKVVSGGDNRSQSVRNGLKALETVAKDDDVVMIHDATHPYIDATAMKNLVEAVKAFGGATLASKNYDTVYRTNPDGFLDKVEPREYIVAGASPEAFRFGDIHNIYFTASDEELSRMTSAGAIALAYNIPMKVIPTDVLNLKITYPNDLNLFLKLIHTYFFPNTDEEGI